MNDPRQAELTNLRERARFLEQERQKAVSMAAQLRSENMTLRKALKAQQQQVKNERFDRIERRIEGIESKLDAVLRHFTPKTSPRAVSNPNRSVDTPVDNSLDQTYILPFE